MTLITSKASCDAAKKEAYDIIMKVFIRDQHTNIDGSCQKNREKKSKSIYRRFGNFMH